MVLRPVSLHACEAQWKVNLTSGDTQASNPCSRAPRFEAPTSSISGTLAQAVALLVDQGGVAPTEPGR